MKQFFIPYDLAKQLKEKGFNEPCLAYFTLVTEKIYLSDENLCTYQNLFKDYILAPIYDQVLDWFLNEHKIYVSHTFSWSNGFDGLVDTNDEWRLTGYGPNKYDSLNEAIKIALNLIK